MNLAKTELRAKARPQRTFRRETTMPRQNTDAPGLEVNARIQRPDMSGAEELQKVLGLINATGQKAIGQMQDSKNAKDAADAKLDFTTGARDDGKFKKSYAYYDAYQREGAKALATDLSIELTNRVNERLNDSENPATLEEIDDLVEETIRGKVFDKSGKLLDFGTPEAKTILGNALSEARSTLLPQAQAAIKAQTDEQFLRTWGVNVVSEWHRQAPIGAAVKVEAQPDVDPLSPGPDPLAPTMGEAPAAAPDAAPATRRVSLGKPTGRLPVQGAITATLAAHRARGSMGVDIDGKIGDPVEAPAGGKAFTGQNAKSGKFIRIEHDNGVVSTYAHLSGFNVKDGDIVRPGQKIGAVGNTGNVRSRGGGDGSHLHYRIKVKGKDVDPISYRFADGGQALASALPTGDEPQLLTPDQAAPAAIAALPKFDFEAAMKRLPPSVSKTAAKKFLVQSLVNEANKTGDVRILASLEESTRADGSPSFTPVEIEQIANTREQLVEKVRVRSERAKKEFHDKNEEILLEALLGDNPPSMDFIKQAGIDDLVDDKFAMALVNTIEADQRQAERETRADEKEAEYRANSEFDGEAQSLVMLRESGDLTGATVEDDKRRFNSGELGTGKAAIRRYRMLRAAANRGEAILMQNPEVGRFAGLLKMQYGGSRRPTTMLEKARSGGQVNYVGMLAHYKSKVGSGMDPAEAYQSAIKTFAPPATNQVQAMRDRAAELQRRRAQEGR